MVDNIAILLAIHKTWLFWFAEPSLQVEGFWYYIGMLILKIVLLLLRQSLEFSRKDKYNIFTRFLYSPSSLRLKLVCKMWTHSTFESCDKGQTTTIIRWKADIARAYQLGRCSTVNGIQLKIGTTVHIFESFHFLKILSPHLLIKRYQQDRTTDYILEHAFVVLKKV